MVSYRWSAGDGAVMATPDPLSVNLTGSLHTADTSEDGRLDLGELLRVIELYNTRFGTVRTGRYAVEEGTEDGFTVDTSGAEAVLLTRYHSADTSLDGKLSLSELLRLIELYNARDGTVRTGAYRAAVGTEDGFEGVNL